MESAAFRALIRQGEGVQVEFKARITHREKVARTIAAFANNRGGRILIGVDDYGHVIGVNPEEESFMILQAARDYCQPPVPLTLYEQDHDGHTVLVVEVPESRAKPHAARSKHDEWRVYVRAHDQSIQADKDMTRRLEAEPFEREIPAHLPGPVDTPPPADATEALSRMEQAALLALKRASRLTAKGFASLVNISRQRAVRILLRLTDQGLLLSRTVGKDIYYYLR